MKPIEIKSNIDVLPLMWLPTNKCNYNCSYCIDLDKTYYEKIPWEKTKEFFENMFDHYNKLGIKKYILGISGGEPFVYSKLPEACEYFKNKQRNEGLEIRIHINTNFSRSIKWLESIEKNVDSIGASFHIEYEDQDQFLERVKFLEDKVNISIRLMMHKERFWEIVEFGKRLLERDGRYSVEHAPLFDKGSSHTETYSYPDDQEEFIRNNYRINNFKRGGGKLKTSVPDYIPQIIYDNGESELAVCSKIIAEGHNKFEGWECDIGLSSIQISYNGLLGTSGCSVRDLGNWITGEYEFPTDSVICPRKVCHCGFDINIPKRKIRGS